MKTFKRSIVIISAAVMLLALTACGRQNTQQFDSSSSQSQENQPAESSQDSQAPAESGNAASDAPAAGTVGSKILVAYYSATGSTEAAAGYIADATGGDLFEIVPTEPYTSDDLNWSDPDSRVSREHDDESLRAVELAADTVENWEKYDTVFIGYPIWWGIAAWPTSSFVSANDFTGKTVIPFCTSSSSGLGESGNLLEELSGTGDWLEGRRFSARSAQSDIQSWVNGLGI